MRGPSLLVQWLISPSSAEGVDPIPGGGAKIPHTLGPKNQNIKQKQYCNKFSRDFKNCPHQKILKKKKICNENNRMAIIQKADDIECAQECRETGLLLMEM